MRKVRAFHWWATLRHKTHGQSFCHKGLLIQLTSRLLGTVGRFLEAIVEAVHFLADRFHLSDHGLLVDTEKTQSAALQTLADKGCWPEDVIVNRG